jgi:hypothetical protein
MPGRAKSTNKENVRGELSAGSTTTSATRSRLVRTTTRAKSAFIQDGAGLKM